MRMWSAFLLAILLMIGLYGIVFTNDAYTRQRRHDTDYVVLYLQWFDQAQFAGFYVAQKMKFYDDLNISVKIVARPKTPQNGDAKGNCEDPSKDKENCWDVP